MADRPITPTAQSRADLLLNLIRQAAIDGDRMPTLQGLRRMGHRDPNASLRRLAASGRIRIEVYGRNWRVVEICRGPHAGKRTAESPRGGRPYLVVDAGGTRKDVSVHHRNIDSMEG